MTYVHVDPEELGAPKGWTNGMLGPAGGRILFIAGQDAAEPGGLNHDQAMNYNPSHKPATINAASAVLETTHSKQELVRFLHTTCFYPVKSTWLKAIANGNFATFPGLTTSLVSKYLSNEIPTIHGHRHKNK